MTLTFRKGCPIPTHIFRVSVTKLANERARLATKVNSDFAFYHPPLLKCRCIKIMYFFYYLEIRGWMGQVKESLVSVGDNFLLNTGLVPFQPSVVLFVIGLLRKETGRCSVCNYTKNKMYSIFVQPIGWEGKETGSNLNRYGASTLPRALVSFRF